LEKPKNLTKITKILPNFSINCSGKLIDLSSPKVMGIVNVTPDSFFKGSRSVEKADILHKVEKMLVDGATFIDIGGHSTRPNAPAVPEAEEMESYQLLSLLSKSFLDLCFQLILSEVLWPKQL
jgi:dihydropteroate synthase